MVFKTQPHPDPDPVTPMKIRWLKKNGNVNGYMAEIDNGMVSIHPLKGKAIIAKSWVDAGFIIRDNDLADEWTDEND